MTTTHQPSSSSSFHSTATASSNLHLSLNAFQQPQEDDWDCPLCMEEMDAADRLFRPCPCGYQICRFCWHKINQDMNKLCPACRREYCPEWIQAQNNALAASRSSSNTTTTGNATASTAQGNSQSSTSSQSFPSASKRSERNSALQSPSSGPAQDRENKDRELLVASRKHLTNLRVIQKNLVYVIGISPKIASEDLLVLPEYFGQYGKIVKIVVNKRNYIGVNSGHLPSASVYVTYAKREDAAKAIKLVDGTVFDGRTLRASYGTTKYCTFFLRGIACQNPGCMYLHDPGEEQDSFTKEQMAEGWHLDRFVPREEQLVSESGGPRPAFQSPSTVVVINSSEIQQSTSTGQTSSSSSSNVVVPKVPLLRDLPWASSQLQYSHLSSSSSSNYGNGNFFSFNPFVSSSSNAADVSSLTHFLPFSAPKSPSFDDDEALWSGNVAVSPSCAANLLPLDGRNSPSIERNAVKSVSIDGIKSSLIDGIKSSSIDNVKSSACSVPQKIEKEITKTTSPNSSLQSSSSSSNSKSTSTKSATAQTKSTSQISNSSINSTLNTQAFKRALEAWISSIPTCSSTSNYTSSTTSSSNSEVSSPSSTNSLGSATVAGKRTKAASSSNNNTHHLSSTSTSAEDHLETFHKACTASLHGFLQNMSPMLLQELLQCVDLGRLCERRSGAATTTSMTTEGLLLEGLQSILQQQQQQIQQQQ